MVSYSVTRKLTETLATLFRRQCETVSRLRLLCFSFNIYSDVLSTLVLFTLSNLFQAHQKHTQVLTFATRILGSEYAYGGPDRYRPGVQRIVQQPSTN